MLARCLLSSGRSKEVALFYSYSRQDSAVRAHIDEVLGRFKWDVAVRIWYDGMIAGGTEWENEVFKNIDAADIILLFITRSFVRSDYCMMTELPRALARHEAGAAVVIPVIVEETDPDWRTLGFSKLQVLPNNGRPVERWSDRTAALRTVVQGIVDIIVGREIDSATRCRWQLHLQGSLDDFDDDRQLKVIDDLRRISGDATMRPIAVGEGSVVVHMDSTRAGFDSLRIWYRGEESPRLSGLAILRLIEIFGAGVQGGVVELAPGHAGSTPADKNTDWLLYPSEPWVPTLIKGIHFGDEDPFNSMNFVIDSGDAKSARDEFAAESTRLMHYFTTAVTVPNDELWVNLSPDEKNRMIGKALAGTTMGWDLLEMDVKLKRLAASLLHPDCSTGREFWREVHRRGAAELARFGPSLSTFQRVWMVPEKAVVYEHDVEVSPGLRHNGAFVIENLLKVQSEDDYLRDFNELPGVAGSNANDVCTPIFKELVLPEIENEVRHGKSFARERQIFQSTILASWVKDHFKDHPDWKRHINSGAPHLLFPAGIKNIEPVSNLRRMSGVAEDEEPVQRFAATEAPAKERPDILAVETDHAFDRALDEAIVLRERGEAEKSVRMLRQLADELTARFGTSIAATQVAISQLGRSLLAAGLKEEAVDQHRRVLGIRRFILGDDHPYTLNSMSVFASTLEQAGYEPEARRLRAEARERESRTGDSFSIPENREFYELYMQVFREGVFRLARNEYDEHQGRSIARVYFAGAIDLRHIPLQIVRRGR